MKKALVIPGHVIAAVINSDMDSKRERFRRRIVDFWQPFDRLFIALDFFLKTCVCQCSVVTTVRCELMANLIQ